VQKCQGIFVQDKINSNASTTPQALQKKKTCPKKFPIQKKKKKKGDSEKKIFVIHVELQ